MSRPKPDFTFSLTFENDPNPVQAAAKLLLDTAFQMHVTMVCVMSQAMDRLSSGTKAQRIENMREAYELCIAQLSEGDMRSNLQRHAEWHLAEMRGGDAPKPTTLKVV